MTEAAEVKQTVSWSEIKTFQRCPKQHEYKYGERLLPKAKSRPLYLGNWVHRALQSHYVEGDWKIGHAEYVKEWNKLFKEEQEGLRKRGKGMMPPFPELVERIMRSYVWYYREEQFHVVAVEEEFEVKTPLVIDGVRQYLKGIIDLVVEDETGQKWIWDHKTASNIPDPTSFHAMDPQLMVYPWAARLAWGWDVAGIYYNYVKSKPPTIPQLTKTGLVSRRKVVTDYPTLRRFIRDNDLDIADFRDQLRPLRTKSPYLRRYKYPREATVTREILSDIFSVTKHIRGDKRRSRTITRDCQRMCSFHDLCRAELNGLDTSLMRKQMFTLRPKKEAVVDEIMVMDWDEEGDDGEEQE